MELAREDVEASWTCLAERDEWCRVVSITTPTPGAVAVFEDEGKVHCQPVMCLAHCEVLELPEPGEDLPSPANTWFKVIPVLFNGELAAEAEGYIGVSPSAEEAQEEYSNLAQMRHNRRAVATKGL